MAKKAPSKKTAVKKVDPKTTALANFDYGEDADGGFTDQQGEDLLIPFIDVLQPLSPQLDEIEGAKPGMLFNSVTNEVYESLRFVPAIRDWNFVEFVPRKSGGGFVGVHLPDSDVVKEARAAAEGFDYKHGENELAETFYLYSILFDDEGEELGMAVIRFQSTKIRVYKGLMTQLRTIRVPQGDRKVNPPLYAYELAITTVKQKNEHGSWFNYVIRPAADSMRESMIDPAGEPFQSAKALCAMVTEGRAKAAHDSLDNRENEEDAPF